MTSVAIPGYRVEREIGRGSMGVVYMAWHEGLGRRVALKIMHPGLSSDPALIARFEREARTLAVLDHPNLVAVLDTGVVNGCPFLVMKYIEGVSLDQYLDGRPKPLSDVLRVLHQLAAALDYAHSKGVVHRDVKPSNVMVQADGLAVLTDFGIARSDQTAALTHVGQSLGTPAYMAPELFRGEAPTPKSDIYSLGVMLFELVTGRRPYDGGDFFAVMYRQLNDAPPDPSRIVSGLDRRVRDVLIASLERAPAKRYATGRTMMLALEGTLARVPPPAVPKKPKNDALRGPVRDQWGGRTSRLGWILGALLCVATIVVVSALIIKGIPTVTPPVVNNPGSKDDSNPPPPGPVETPVQKCAKDIIRLDILGVSQLQADSTGLISEADTLLVKAVASHHNWRIMPPELGEKKQDSMRQLAKDLTKFYSYQGSPPTDSLLKAAHVYNKCKPIGSSVEVELGSGPIRRMEPWKVFFTARTRALGRGSQWDL